MSTASTPGRPVAAFGAAVCVFHHLGLLGTLGRPGGGVTGADLLDLLTPFAVVGTALAAVASGRPDRRTWQLAAVAVLTYTLGKGIHLAANSISNARGDAAPVHLWDEVVGHAIWYAGLALLVVALTRSVQPRWTPLGGVLAAGVGVTWATNALGADGLVLPMLGVALAFTTLGWRQRAEGVGRLLLVAYGLAVPVLAVGALLR